MNILHWVNFFNKGLDESDKKEGLLKRLKNTEGQNKEQLDGIKYQGERQVDMTHKQGKKNLEAINKHQKKFEKIVLLRDGLNFTDKGKDILKKLTNDERLINYNNFLF